MVTNTRSRLPVFAAVGGVCTLAASGASAIELGEIQIRSALGQPLRASIAYALNPEEQIASHCIFLKSGKSADGMPLLSQARVQVTDGAIILSGGAAIREPMLAMQLSISCPNTARLAREYTLMFNPAVPGDGEAVAALPVATAPRRSQPRPAARPEPAARAAARVPTASPEAATAQGPSAAASAASESSRTPASAATRNAEPASSRASASSPAAIAGAAANVDLSTVPTRSRYQVQSGDTLSEIVSRIDDRPSGLWRSVGHVFAANPHAFIDGDMNLIKAGSWLDIPDLYAAAGQPATATAAAITVTDASMVSDAAQGLAAGPQENTSPADSGSAFDTGFATQPEAQPATPEVSPAPQPELAANATRPEALEPNTNALEPAIPQIPQPAQSIRPADVAVGTDIPVSDTGTTGIAASSTQGVATDLAAGEAGGRSWLFWLGGAGLALILGLLLFGRSSRSRAGSSPSDLYDGDAYGDNADIGGQMAATDFDATQVDESRMNRKLTLDADLGSGTGLQLKANADAAENFGYGMDDAGLPVDDNFAETQPGGKDTSATDIVPLLRVEDSMILHGEVPPDHRDAGDTDDQSVIVDMQTLDTGELKRGAPDMGGVEMPDSNSATGILQGLTLNEEIDLDTLTRDYEEELAQTQNVNAEVAKAAIEIAETLDNSAYSGVDLADEVNEDISADDMSDLTAALTEADLIGEGVGDMTAAIPANLRADEEVTAAMPINALSDKEMTELTAAMQIDPSINEEMTDLTVALPADTLIGEEQTGMTAAMPADALTGEELTDLTAAMPADALTGEELTDLTAAMPADALTGEELTAAMPADSLITEDMSNLTAAMPTLSELDIELDRELAPTGMTSPTAILPNDSMPGETAELTAHLPAASSAENDDNIGDLDATGIIEVPTAQMPSLEEVHGPDAGLDEEGIDDKKNKKAG